MVKRLCFTQVIKTSNTVILKSAKAKGYEVLLLDSPIVSHLMQKLESTKENITFARVDSDHIDKIIAKNDDGYF